MRVLIISTILFFLLSATDVSADIPVAESSAQLVANTGQVEDYRVEVLRKYFGSYNSPLTDYAGDFVKLADKYNLDWRLVPAITGVESTFGKRIPVNSYNAYGWTNGAYHFSSWEESIEVVSKALREKYYDRGAINIYQIARRYAPPSSTWAGKVKSIMKKINSLPVTFTLEG